VTDLAPPPPALTTVASGLGYPEAPRWHDGRIWCTDFITRTVQSVGPDGSIQVCGYLPAQPSGLGFRPDGEMLVVSVYDRKLIRFADGAPRVAADLGGLADSPLNDMALGPDGTAYVGVLGLETAYRPHTEIGSGTLVMVTPEGRSAVVASDLGVPNGIAVSADGSWLVVAETRARRLTAYDIAPDGTLAGRRLFADCGRRMPDGIALDAENAVWMGCPFSEEFVRVEAGGRVLEIVPTPGKWAVACAFGGPEMAHLYCTTARTTRPELFRGRSTGFVEVFEPGTPGR
jgi:sugar lactone lactonase YvrE